MAALAALADSETLGARLTALASFGAGRAPAHATGPAARRYLAAQRSGSPRRVVRDAAGARLRFVATPAGGDCGWEAVSWALLASRGHGPGTQQVRAVVRAHVAENRAAYAGACGMGPAEVSGFLASVLRPGITGHWLGQSWGALELVAVARALRITLRLYAWDPARQAVREYFAENAGPDAVHLLFTGSAERGHFDVLLPEPEARKWAPFWRRRAAKKARQHLASGAG